MCIHIYFCVVSVCVGFAYTYVCLHVSICVLRFGFHRVSKLTKKHYLPTYKKHAPIKVTKVISKVRIQLVTPPVTIVITCCNLNTTSGLTIVCEQLKTRQGLNKVKAILASGSRIHGTSATDVGILVP